MAINTTITHRGVTVDVWSEGNEFEGETFHAVAEGIGTWVRDGFGTVEAAIAHAIAEVRAATPTWEAGEPPVLGAFDNAEVALASIDGVAVPEFTVL